jgi:hypothetical protein
MLVDDCFPEKQQPATTHPTLSLCATESQGALRIISGGF